MIVFSGLSSQESKHRPSLEFGLDGPKAKSPITRDYIVQLKRISPNAFIQNFKIINNYLGFGDGFSSARDNNLFQLSALLNANLYLAVIR